MKDKKLNLYEKLIEIRKQVLYVKKGDKAYNFNYTKPSVIIGLLRPKMDELGVILSYDIIDTELTEVERYAKSNITKIGIIKAKFVFEFINAENPEEKISKTITTMIRGDDISDMGSLSTYTLRYFLLGYFNIPNDKDDPDTHEKSLARNTYKAEEEEGIPIEEVEESIYIDANQIKCIKNMLDYLNNGSEKVLLKSYNIESLEQLKKENYEKTVRALNKRIEIKKEESKK